MNLIPIEPPGSVDESAGSIPVIASEVIKHTCAVYADTGYEPPWIYLGSVKQNPTTLTRQDWRGPRASWRSDGLGYWETYIERDGTYEFILRFAELPDKGSIHLKIGDVAEKARVSRGSKDHTFKSVKLLEGHGRVEAWIDINGTTTGVHYVDVRRVRR